MLMRLFSKNAYNYDKLEDFGYGFNRGVVERIVRTNVAGSFFKCKCFKVYFEGSQENEMLCG